MNEAPKVESAGIHLKIAEGDIAPRYVARSAYLLYGVLALASLALVAVYITTMAPLFFVAPYVDDVDSTLNFLIEASKTNSVWEKFVLATHQHNEHRIASAKITALLITYFQGTFSFVTSSWCALILALLASALLLLSVQGSERLPAWCRRVAVAFPLACFVCQPIGYEGILWTTVSVGTAYCSLFAALCAYCAFSKGWISLVGAVLFALASVYSLGNGIILLGVIPFVLLLRREWLRAAVFTLGAAGICALYFQGYSANPQHPKISDSLPHIDRNIEYLGIFMGLVFAWGSKVTALWWGGSLALLSLILFSSGYHKRNPVLSTMVLFILGSMAINALSRSEFGVEYALQQKRYLLVASLLPAFLGAALVDRFHHSNKSLWCVLPVWIGSAVFTYASYTTYLPEAEQLHTRVKVGLRQWAQEGVGLVYPWADRADAVVGESIRRGLYDPGERNSARALARLRKASGAAQAATNP